VNSLINLRIPRPSPNVVNIQLDLPAEDDHHERQRRLNDDDRRYRKWSNSKSPQIRDTIVQGQFQADKCRSQKKFFAIKLRSCFAQQNDTKTKRLHG